MFVLVVMTFILPALIAIGIARLWLTSNRLYLALVFLAAVGEYVFWVSTLRTTLTTAEYQATLRDYALLPTIAFVIVMTALWYVLRRSRRRVRA